MATNWEGIGDRALTQHEFEALQRLVESHPTTPLRMYPLATILNPRRNISIRRTRQEIRREILAWLFATVSLGLLIYATCVAIKDALSK